MTGQEKIKRAYMISIRKAGDAAPAYRVSYVPRGLQAIRDPGMPSKRVPEYVATVQAEGGPKHVQWDTPPMDPEATQQEFDHDARRRSKLLHEWLGNIGLLIELVRGWSMELDWSSKAIDKPMEDSEIGKYRAPVLMLQQDLAKVMLEPITRSAPGTEGVVDLYLLPGYDDIASLYYHSKQWNLHYMSPRDKSAPNIRETEAQPLTKASLQKVLEEMKANVQ